MTTRPYPSFAMYQDKDGYWRWALAVRPDHIVAVSALRFQRAEGCARSIAFMQRLHEVPMWGAPAGISPPEPDELVLSEEQILSDYETD